LRGARDDGEFERLRQHLEAVRFIDAHKSTWTLAGRLLSDLDRRGEAIPLQDAVIAAQALEGNHAVFTRDEHFRRVPGLKLHSVSEGTVR
jgi:predicted nucleic acid-binding protein